MSDKKLDPNHHEDIDQIIERYRRLAGYDPPMSTFEKEMFIILQKDNETLIAEVERLRQVVSDLRSQRRLEGVRELEAQFPRKKKRRSSARK